MSYYNELVSKYKGFHEFHDSNISLKDLKVLSKMVNSFQSEIKQKYGIFVKIPPHFLLRLGSSFKRESISKIFNIFEEVVIKNNSSWEYKIKNVWDGRQELKDIYETFFLVFKFHRKNRVDLISSGKPGERESNKTKKILGLDNESKKKVLSSKQEDKKRRAKREKKALKRQLREGGRK